MPKTTMHKDNFSSTYKYNVGFAGEIAAVQSIAISQSMNY